MSAMYYTDQGRDLDFRHDPFKAMWTHRPYGGTSTVNAKGEVNLTPYGD